MRRKNVREQARDIAAASRRIEHWRRTREKQSPMPEELWKEATCLGQKHGVSTISRQLGLGYAALRKRVAAADDALAEGHAGEPRFVELRVGELLGGGVARGAVVELSGGDGSRMTVRLDSDERLDVARLVATFLGPLP